MLTTLRSGRAAPAVLLLAVLSLAGCAAAGAPSASSPPTGAPSQSAPPASVDPGDPGDGSGAVGGGSGGDPGTGIGAPVDPTPIDPGAGQPALLVPKPGQLNPHPVAPQTLQASVDGRHVLVKVSWYGGIAPCSVLDSVKVERSGMTIALTVIEGASEADAICAEIAMLKATIVDLGDLDPGTWTITAPNSDAPPVTLTIE